MAKRALKAIGSFDGQGDVDRWIQRFEMAVVIDEEKHEAQQLSIRLEGGAYDTWLALSELDRTSAGAIKAALRRVYGKTPLDAMWRQS